MSAQHTPGPWKFEPDMRVDEHARPFDPEKEYLAGWNVTNGETEIVGIEGIIPGGEAEANARLIAAAPDLLAALTELADVFAQDGERPGARFDRLATMFYKDTGYLAPGKDVSEFGPDQPDGPALLAIYDAWYLGKVTRARAAIALATQEPTR